jgi:hypothetical protein
MAPAGGPQWREPEPRMTAIAWMSLYESELAIIGDLAAEASIRRTTNCARLRPRSAFLVSPGCHYRVMLNFRFELQQILFIFRVVLGFQRLIAGESTDIGLRIPMRDGQKVTYAVLFSPHNLNTKIAWN